ncbi:MAG TPA: hypothetical protein VLJ13_01330, partial [Brevundimonas sp.]|nr:hypothetical protein [Brevundimonas sp.]
MRLPRLQFLLLCGLAACAATAAFSPAAAGATTPYCGSASLITPGGTWQCTFADDFDGTSLDTSKWIPQRTDQSGYTNGAT